MKIREIFKDKKLIIRIILFIIAFAVAVTAFTKGALSLSNNREGYQTVSASPDEEAVMYAADFTLNYYFTGKSGEIRDLRKAITSVYSGALNRAYKLLDPVHEYEGFTNLATLNSRPGENIKVSPELYGILKDAYEKTWQKTGYNMFAGALYGFVNSILILEEPEEFDPLLNPETAGRIEALAGMIDADGFGLRFADDNECVVRLDISDAYLKKAEELEVREYAVLDLNLLKNAYIMEIVVNALDEAGYTNGYISTGSGLTCALSAQEGLEYCIYGLKDSTPAILKTLKSQGRAVYSSIRAFGFANESLYYSIKGDGKIIYRNPYVSADSGRSNDSLLSLYTVYYNDENQQEKGPMIVNTMFADLCGWFGRDPYDVGNVRYHIYSVSQDATDKVAED
ncbi:MAG: hypothetical protein K6E62_02535, partial [Lachnospiraceae bacterium]|nr:hypothetical protein [Lachnospiraceae bacterium]